MKDDACGVGVVATPAPSNDKHLTPFYLATSTLKQERGGGTLDSLSINRHCCSCCCAPKNNRPPLSSPRFHLPLTRSYCCHCFSLGLVSFRETSHLSNDEGVLSSCLVCFACVRSCAEVTSKREVVVCSR